MASEIDGGDDRLREFIAAQPRRRGVGRRIAHANAASIDGLPGLDTDHRLPSAVVR